MHAEKALSKVDRNFAKAMRRMNILISSMDRASDIYNARLEGREEGRLEGREEGQRENTLQIARNLLAKGATPEFVLDITGLDIETIANLGQA